MQRLSLLGLHVQLLGNALLLRLNLGFHLGNSGCKRIVTHIMVVIHWRIVIWIDIISHVVPTKIILRHRIGFNITVIHLTTHRWTRVSFAGQQAR